MSRSRTTVLLLPAFSLALGACAPVRQSPPPAQDAACMPLSSSFTIGPALLQSQVEQKSLATLETAPSKVPRVPFGLLNAKWLALMRSMQSSDTIHRFCTDSTEGYLVLRGSCVVGKIVTMMY